jgi:hypothetical protein
MGPTLIQQRRRYVEHSGSGRADASSAGTSSSLTSPSGWYSTRKAQPISCARNGGLTLFPTPDRPVPYPSLQMSEWSNLLKILT